MKNVLKLALALMLPMVFVAAPVQAAEVDPGPCIAQIDDMITATQALVVTDAKQAAKIRGELVKPLNEAKKFLMLGGNQNFYKAAMKLWQYDWKLRVAAWQYRVDITQARSLDEDACSAMQCIVALYSTTGYQCEPFPR